MQKISQEEKVIRHRLSNAAYKKRRREAGMPVANGNKTAQAARWRKRDGNLKKKRAHYAVSYALKEGILVKQPCEKCGTVLNVHAHHDDYEKQLEVRWLCAYHHAEHHRQKQ